MIKYVNLVKFGDLCGMHLQCVCCNELLVSNVCQTKLKKYLLYISLTTVKFM